MFDETAVLLVEPWRAAVYSVAFACVATVISLGVGVLASLALAGRPAGALDGFVLLPLGASAVMLGFGFVIAFDTPPLEFRSSWWLVPVGHALVAVPFVVRICVGVLRSVDPAMTDAAATLGAAPVRAWRTTVVPYLWRPLRVGAALAAAISLGEFGATSFLSRSGGETLPITIEQLLGRTGTTLQAQGYVLATMLAVVTVLLVVAVERAQTDTDRALGT